MGNSYHIIAHLLPFCERPWIPLLFEAISLHCDGVSMEHLAYGIIFCRTA